MKSLAALFLLCTASITLAVDLILPTANDGLFTGHPDQFYMYVNRWVGGTQTLAWEGGQYGFVRDPHTTSLGTICTRFHEGIDIRPLERDAKGNPLDRIHAIAAGKVAYTNPDARGSNYGRYVVIEHQWDGCAYYSLYAHLNEIYVAPGAEVAQGDTIAMMGYTGTGIDRERAHVHLEVGLLLNDHFDGFSELWSGLGGNRHGIYNGANLGGIDVARLYQEARANPALTIPGFFAKQEAYFHADVPGSFSVALLKRYPWMAPVPPAGDAFPPGGWRIYFTQGGIPLRVERLPQVVSAATVTIEKPVTQPLNQLTRGLVTGTCVAPLLTESGKELLSLLTYEPPAVVAAVATPLQPGTDAATVLPGQGVLLFATKSHIKAIPSEPRKAAKTRTKARRSSG